MQPDNQLRRILQLEQEKKFGNKAVIGGLDSYILQYLQNNPLPRNHPFLGIMRLLPPKGYAALHPIQRRRVVDKMLKALETDPTVTKNARKERVVAKTKSSPKGSRKTSIGSQRALTISSPITTFKGVNKINASRMERLGIRTVKDLLFFFPHRYNDFANIRPISELDTDKDQTVIASVWGASATKIGRKKATEAIVGDDTGTIRVIWWGQTYIARQLTEGKKIALSGRVRAYRGRHQMESPEWEPLQTDSIHTSRLVPVYPGTEGLAQRLIRRITKEAIDQLSNKLIDVIPKETYDRHNLMPLGEAIRQIHFPDNENNAEKARQRIAFEELLLIQLGILKRKQITQSNAISLSLSVSEKTLTGFIESLPFELTKAQQKCISELLTDISKDQPMNRLLQGDVGSGKTVVAATGILAAISTGCQGAIMAPTEILAEQHYRTFTSFFGDPDNDLWNDTFTPPYLDRPFRISLLTGSMSKKDKVKAQTALASGETDITIGTQALIQESVSFSDLGFVVVDEQHRFGVDQRAALRQKASSPPHVLVMTATPIPRTLSLTVYGDLDISVMNEVPPGRPIVKTHRLRPEQRQQAYDFARTKINDGRQAYIICPLVEESEIIVAKSAVQEYERLSQKVFPDLRIGLLHGRLSPSDKEEVMRSFREGDLDILVSTAVVEVGVDVPNATIMLIEGADRFGLAQLHQFRGRVRRSEKQSHCLLLSESKSQESQERLAIMETIYDGFELAEEDLKLRGPGEFFGTRQSGLPDLHATRISDAPMIELARNEAASLLKRSPSLDHPEYGNLRKAVSNIWKYVTTEVS